MVDDFYGDATGFGLGEVARGVAVQGGPGFGVDFGFQGGFQGAVGVVGAEEIGVADEETFVVINEVAGGMFGLRELAQQVIGEGLGMDLFPDVERRGVNDEFRPVFILLPEPDELMGEVAIAAFVGDAHAALIGLLEDGLGRGVGRFLGHGVFSFAIKELCG